MTSPNARTLRLGTRKSPLAMAQSGMMARALEAAHTGLTVEMITITTQGDRSTDRPLTEIGGAGLFVKELEQALLDDRVDLAVHSLKDLPTEEAPGLTVHAVPLRAPAFDALITTDGRALEDLPPGARVGTGSPRRRVQLMARRPDLQLMDLRGNIDTRLGRLDAGDFDAIILAAAGLERLGVADGRKWRALTPDVMIPAVGQGCLALQGRTDDARVREALLALDHADSHAAALAERALLKGLGGGCLAPIAAFATVDEEGTLTLQGLVGRLSDGFIVKDRVRGPRAEAEALGARLAAQLKDHGAADLLFLEPGRPA